MVEADTGAGVVGVRAGWADTGVGNEQTDGGGAMVMGRRLDTGAGTGPGACAGACACQLRCPATSPTLGGGGSDKRSEPRRWLGA